MDRILIPEALLEEITRHAAEGMPDEVCGLLLGTGDKVSRLIRMRNAVPTPYSYAFDPKEQFEAMKRTESLGLELLGIYHSHPGSSCYPSAIDIDRAFFPGSRQDGDLCFPGIYYVIIALSSPGPAELGAFKISPQGDVAHARIERY
jgi:proteasome lid subunit RPN8/RPN11